MTTAMSIRAITAGIITLTLITIAAADTAGGFSTMANCASCCLR